MRCVYLPKDCLDNEYNDTSSYFLSLSNRRQVLHIIGRGLPATNACVRIQFIRYIEALPNAASMDLFFPTRPDPTNVDMTSAIGGIDPSQVTFTKNDDKPGILSQIGDTIWNGVKWATSKDAIPYFKDAYNVVKSIGPYVPTAMKMIAM